MATAPSHWIASNRVAAGVHKEARKGQIFVQTAKRVYDELDELLQQPDGPERRLFEAMRYTALAGGKAFRPFLCMETARLFGVEEDVSVHTATAIEAVHCYSLIHDDLPAMDDDDMRRGQPSLHKAFDEASAILAGDALLTLAFEILADEKTHKAMQIRLHLITALARAIGMHGMVGGQMIDVLSAVQKLDAGSLTRLQKMKTGALISFAVDAGALLGEGDKAQRHALAGYAHDVGLAFQITDDILDAGATGYEIGQNDAPEKASFVSLLGVERAQAQAQLLVEQALAYLDMFGTLADPLRAAGAFVIARKS